MDTLLEVLGACVLAGGAATAGGAAAFRSRLRRANRVADWLELPPVPTSWLWSFRRVALLHRRLRAVCELARAASIPAAAPPPRRRFRRRTEWPSSPFSRVAGELVDHAIAVDGRLVAADRMGGHWRRQALTELEGEVRALESSAARLSHLSTSLRRSLDSATQIPRPDLDAQLDAVEAALAELNP